MAEYILVDNHTMIYEFDNVEDLSKMIAMFRHDMPYHVGRSNGDGYTILSKEEVDTLVGR